MVTDRELIQRVVDGDPAAADLFVVRFSRFVWAVLQRDLGLHPSDAEDVFQQVFARLWDDDRRRLRNWRGEGSFVGYLAPIVKHLALDRLGAPDPAAPNPDPDPPELPSEAPGADELAWVAEQRAALERAVERLGARDRELYDRRFRREQSYREIARATGLTVNNVGVALLRLERRLARWVAEQDAPRGRRWFGKGKISARGASDDRVPARRERP